MSISIIITALDEPYVNKTIDDILEKTGDSLKEIIVIDDHSKEPIKHSGATVYRNKQRMGLQWSRQAASQLAKSDLVISIDPHCKVYEGWEEVMCDPIRSFYKTITTPRTYKLNPETWENYDNGKAVGHKTLWNWKLDFNWSNGPGAYTPSIAGHCFAFSKKWWLESGGFDESMKVWGGENIEFSLMTWLCGGQVLVTDCFVSHWFKKKFQYDFDSETLLYNKARIAEVWFEEYKHRFYKEIKKPLGSIDCGDLTKKRMKKKELQKRPFRWFVENINPGLLR